MATDKKHIAVYLDPAVEQALVAFCQEKGLISRKGTMYSAGVNAALAAFFGVAGTGNIPTIGNIPTKGVSSIPNDISNIPDNIPSESLVVAVMPGKSEFRLDDSVQAALVDVEDAKKHSQIYGFNSDEALADAYFQVNMLTSNYDELEDRHEALKKELAIANQKVSDRDEEIERLESELASRSEQIAAPIAIELPEPADLLDQLRAKHKKFKCGLADVEAILDMLDSLLP